MASQCTIVIDDDSEKDSPDAEPPVCQYGRQCYRKNPAHFLEFAHPWLDKEGGEEMGKDRSGDDDDDELCPSSSKRARLETAGDRPSTSKCVSEPEQPAGLTMQGSRPVQCSDEARPLFYLTKVRGIGKPHNQSDRAIGIRDILCPSLGDLVASAQFNYLTDIPWLIQQYPANKRGTPILLVHGEQREGLMRLRSEAKPFPNIKLLQAKLEIMFGTHHSKMMLLAYQSGMRVVIHTANLISKDWDQKTQGVWMSPLFPKLDSSSGQVPGKLGAGPGSTAAQDTGFKKDLLEYLNAYGEGASKSGLNEWKLRIQEHDLSPARVRLIASVPGAHTGPNMLKWGHMKLRKVLSEHGPVGGEVDAQWPVVGQFSSIGSLGPTAQQWLTSEWLHSLSCTNKPRGLGKTATALTEKKYPCLQLVFPSVDNVKNFLEGYMAGASIPYAQNNAIKQPYLTDYMCQWKADERGRSRASPHIKTYLRMSPDCSRLAWFLITSANLSKAAWGAMEKKGAQLKIRSYEIGVLFLPGDQIQEPPQTMFTVSHSDRESVSNPMNVPVPIDLPLTAYTKKDRPWVWNKNYLEPDCNGCTWTPGRR